MSDRRSHTVAIAVLSILILIAAFVGGYLLLPHEPAAPPVAAGPELVAPEPAPAAVDNQPPVAPLPEVQPAALQGVIPVGPPPTPAALVKSPFVVYQSDFTTQPGDEWNTKKTDRTIAGSRPHLGGFRSNDKPQPILTLKALPPHKLMRITFDLYLMRSWDGSSPIWGPGLFDMNLGLDDGRSLIHATFGNCGFFSNNNEQSFPDNYPAKPYPAWTLATEHETLGTIQDWGPASGGKYDASSVYHLVLAVPHTDASIAYTFRTTLPDNNNKPYGLANMTVEALPELATFTPEQMAVLWKDLGGEDAQTFYDARWKLISAGDAATEYIANHIDNLKIPDKPTMFDPQGTAEPYAMDPPVIHRERARNVLEAIHTPTAKALEQEIPTVNKKYSL